jgi:hypothetical protein
MGCFFAMLWWVAQAMKTIAHITPARLKVIERVDAFMMAPL